ncbi:MAG: hypothetical protein O7B79_10580 [SAR324 cluster bacterium]|nr:hypothetical protein [SAR324 cluster bacterium]
MKRGPVLTILLSISIMGGFLFLFPVEWVGLLILLLGLIAGQVIIMRRHLNVVGSSRSALHEAAVQAASRPVSRVDGLAPSSNEDAEAPFDPALFSRFREQLDSAERESAGKAPQPPQPASEQMDSEQIASEQPESGAAPAGEATAEPSADSARPEGPAAPAQADNSESPADGEDDSVRVVLSPAARKKAGEAPTPAQPLPNSDQAGGEDLFAGLRPNPAQGTAAGVSTVYGPTRQPARQAHAASEPEEAGFVPDEVQAALADGGQQVGEVEQAPILLKLAEEALHKGDQAGARAGLEQVLALYAESQNETPWRLKLMQARLAVLEGNFDGALQGYEEFLDGRPELEEADFVGQIEEMTAAREGAAIASFRVSLFMKLLAAYRQANDRPAMDRIYGLIEEAQEHAGDEQKLIQYYKNHLEIKTVMEDVEGQLDLIDRIGNRYYKLGDTETARQFYEQGLKLREEQQASADKAGSSP